MKERNVSTTTYPNSCTRYGETPNSCTRYGETGHHLHVLVDGAGAMHHRGEEKHERALFLEVITVAITSTPTNDT
jgi:hypothetical protein